MRRPGSGLQDRSVQHWEVCPRSLLADDKHLPILTPLPSRLLKLLLFKHQSTKPDALKTPLEVMCQAANMRLQEAFTVKRELAPTIRLEIFQRNKHQLQGVDFHLLVGSEDLPAFDLGILGHASVGRRLLLPAPEDNVHRMGFLRSLLRVASCLSHLSANLPQKAVFEDYLLLKFRNATILLAPKSEGA